MTIDNIKQIKLSIKNNYEKVNNNKLLEYYIKDNRFYKYCRFSSFDGRQFGFILNENNDRLELFIVRELNKDYFLLSRIDKHLNNKKQKHSLDLIIKKTSQDKLILLAPNKNSITYFGELINPASQNKLNIIKQSGIKEISNLNILIDNTTLGYKIEKAVFKQNITLNQKFKLSRILIPENIEPLLINQNKKKDTKRICVLNSYPQSDSTKTEYIKNNIANLNQNSSKTSTKTNLYRPQKINLKLNHYIEKYDSIIYYGHGYSSKQFMKIELDRLTELYYEKSSDKLRDYFIIIACNETKNNYTAEYNSVLSLFRAGFKEILLTDSKVIVEQINRSTPILLGLISITNSISEALLFLNRLNRSMVKIESPFRLYKNPFLCPLLSGEGKDEISP